MNTQETDNNNFARNRALQLASYARKHLEDTFAILDLAEDFRKFLMPRGDETVTDREEAIYRAIQSVEDSNNVLELAEEYCEFLLCEPEPICT